MAGTVVRMLPLLLAVCAIHTGTAIAQGQCIGTTSRIDADAERRQLWKLLNEREFNKLDADLLDRQQRYERGTYGEADLLNAFGTFNSASTRIGPLLEEWVSTHKKSYAAYVAMAWHQAAVAMELRGSRVVSETSEQQLTEMNAWMRKAQSTLVESFGMTEKPIVSYVVALDVDKYIGTRDSIEDLYQRALAIDPRTAFARQRYLWALDPRWHGASGDLLQEIQRIKASNLADDTKHFVAYYGYMSLAGAFRLHKDPDSEEKVLQAAANECVAYEGPWQDLAELYNRTQKWKQAVDALEKYLAIKPGQAWAIRREAFAHEKLSEWSEALALYKAAAEKGDAYAQNAYGWQLYKGEHVPRDLDAAIKLFELAARQGNDAARINLAEARKLAP